MNFVFHLILYAVDGVGLSLPAQVTVWGVFFSGLVFLGRHLPARDGRGRFPANTLVFGTAWGWHAAPDRLPTPTLPSQLLYGLARWPTATDALHFSGRASSFSSMSKNKKIDKTR